MVFRLCVCICRFHIFEPMNMHTGPRTGPNKRIHMKITYRAIKKTNYSVSLLHWAGRVGLNWWIDKFMQVFSWTTLRNVTMSSHMHLRILGIAEIYVDSTYSSLWIWIPDQGPDQTKGYVWRVHIVLLIRPMAQCRFCTGPVGLDSTDESISSWRFFL